MAYRKLLSTLPGEGGKNTQIAVKFLVDQFCALHRKHPFHDNMILLDGRSWWVIPATGSQGVDLCNGRDEDPVQLVAKIKQLHASILIFRQMMDHRICIYEIRDLDVLNQRLESSLILLWDTIEIIKSGSDIGILIGDELIGFRKFRQPRPAPVTPMSRTVVDL